MNFSKDNLTENIASILKISPDRIVGLTAVLYFSGWCYVNYFFSSFGINKSSFEFPDYTVFLYSFFVVLKIFDFLLLFTLESWIFSICFVCVVGLSSLNFTGSREKELSIIRNFVVFIAFAVGLFYLSSEAGKLDARHVFEKNARTVTLILKESFRKDLKAYRGKEYADQRLEEINKASKNGGLALVWRNSDESIFLIFEISVGESHGKPLEILRVPNNFIALIGSKPEYMKDD